MNPSPVALTVALLLTLGCASAHRQVVPTGRMDPKTRYFSSQLPKDFNEVVLTDPWKGEVFYRIRGRNLYQELDKIVEFKADGKTDIHRCAGEANILFLKHRKPYYCWNYAHNSFFLDWFTPETNQRLAAWFASKGVKEFQT
jgi:hypothetical protein